MFQLRDQVRQQQVLNLTRGFLSFYDCQVKMDDIIALSQQVEQFARRGHPLRRVSFEFCRFNAEDGTLDALGHFFQKNPSIRTIVFTKNQLSNEEIAHCVRHARNKELSIVLPGGNAALHHRCALLEACQNRVEKLSLDFKGANNFAALGQTVVAGIGGLKCMKQLRLDGFELTDDLFVVLVDGLKKIPVQTLQLGRIRGLTLKALEIMCQLSWRDDGNPSSSQGLEQLHLSAIPSIFVSGEGDESDSRIETVFQNLGVRELSIQESKLERRVVRAMFRGLAENHNAMSIFRLKAWSFGEDEFQELLRCLPRMNLSKLDLSQGGIKFSDAEKQASIVQVLQTNLQMTDLDLSHRGNTLNGASFAPLNHLLRRNRNLEIVRKLLKGVPAGRADVESLVVSRFAGEQQPTAMMDAMFYLLSSRVLANAAP